MTVCSHPVLFNRLKITEVTASPKTSIQWHRNRTSSLDNKLKLMQGPRFQALINLISQTNRIEVSFVFAQRSIDLLASLYKISLLIVEACSVIVCPSEIVAAFGALFVAEFGRSFLSGMLKTFPLRFAFAIDDDLRSDKDNQFRSLKSFTFVSKRDADQRNRTDNGESIPGFGSLFCD